MLHRHLTEFLKPQAEATKRQSAGTYVTEPKDMMDSLLIELDAHAGNEPNYFTCEFICL